MHAFPHPRTTEIMKTSIAILAAIAASISSAAALPAQSGFSLKANTIFNRESVEERHHIPAAVGIGAGAELVLPGGLGIGVSAYSGGRLSTLHREVSSTTVLGEANYHLPIPLLPIRPYAGVHVGLGSYTRAELANPDQPRMKDDLRQLGYQLGVRVPFRSMIGLEAQYRRVSTWLSREQDGRFSREQILVGITIF
jgi:hypothetical protein